MTPPDYVIYTYTLDDDGTPRHIYDRILFKYFEREADLPASVSATVREAWRRWKGEQGE